MAFEIEMMDEWSAWQRVCGLLKERGAEVDLAGPAGSDTLIAAIEMWGELLVALRVRQDAAIGAKALEEKIAAFNALVD